MIKLKDRYYIKIVPARGDTVHRFELTRRHILTGAAIAVVVFFGSLGLAGVQVARAHSEMATLRTQTNTQGQALQQIDRQTDQLTRQLQSVQKENQEVQQLMGVRPSKIHAHGTQTSMLPRAGGTVSQVQTKLALLSAESAATKAQTDSIRTLAMRVLNMRHLAEMARARAIADIPSIDPVTGAQIVGCFCYRTYPSVEFHEGVDLGADEGDTVHVSAAGTVVAAGWDGEYGQKIVVDHGNGYQTWYAHLSRIDVTIGQHVFKSEQIGLVGETGFATGPHLHYQVMLHGNAIDPTPYLTGVPANVLASLP
jgi:murein DD-endopeptidase MepM/ murein hydrolase activator NlpD